MSLSILLKKIRIIVVSIFFIPHFVLWHLSSQRKIINKDVESIEEKKILPFKGIILKAYLLQKDLYFRQLFYYRIGAVSKICRWYSPGKNTFTIACDSLGEGAYFPHAYSTWIFAYSIGKNFVCRQCTTIGNKNDFRNDLRPIIGDNVVLGANVCIIGNVKVGNNVMIGAGSVVVKDVPDNCIVVGNPARVIKNIK